MGKVTRVKGIAAFRRKLVRDMQEREKRLEGAQRAAAEQHCAHLMTHIPVAFGELRASVHVEGTRVVVDAPHAAAVERGSRPHWVPLQALLKWVKLRGFQGLASDDSLSRLPGSTTAGHARSVAGSLAAHNDSSGFGDWSGGASQFSIDPDTGRESGAAVDVAKAIQVKIAREGTKPQWYMRDSLPAARGFLRAEIHKRMTG